jgi:hypothetical protein
VRSFLDTRTRRAGEISGVRLSMLAGKLLQIANRESEEGLRKQRRGNRMVQEKGSKEGD